MALDETAEIAIARAPAEVASYMFNPEHDPAWIGGISEVQPIGPANVTLGSRVRRRASFLGRRIDYVMEVVDLVQDRRLTLHAVEAPMPMDVTYEVEPSADGSVARVRVQGDTGGFYRLAGPLMGAQVRRSIAADVARLKRILEAT
jgi:carbon monoxide dehydrogenase subunit G